MVKTRTPMVTVTDAVAATCPRATVWTLLGRSRTGEPIVALVGKQVYGYHSAGETDWEQALAKVKAAGLEPLEQPPMLTIPDAAGWLVVAKNSQGKPVEATVSLSTGNLNLPPVTAWSDCVTQRASLPTP